VNKIAVFFPFIVTARVVCYPIQTIDIQVDVVSDGVIETVSAPMQKILGSVDFNFFFSCALGFTVGSALLKGRKQTNKGNHGTVDREGGIVEIETLHEWCSERSHL
jgi:hypothetical protein